MHSLLHLFKLLKSNFFIFQINLKAADFSCLPVKRELRGSGAVGRGFNWTFPSMPKNFKINSKIKNRKFSNYCFLNKLSNSISVRMWLSWGPRHVLSFFHQQRIWPEKRCIWCLFGLNKKLKIKLPDKICICSPFFRSSVLWSHLADTVGELKIMIFILLKF